MSTTPKSATDRLVRATAKVVSMAGSQELSTGSGLLMMFFPWGAGDPRIAPALVTNKHVVEGADRVIIQVPRSPPNDALTHTSSASGILFHPDPDVDLCLVPLSLELVKADQVHVIEFISSADIWEQDSLDTLNAIENVIMIGYPDGLIDTKNLYPISRRGVTATPAYARLDDQPDFMIDCACFPGSSGSPVFLLDIGFHVDKNNDTQLGESRFGLLGFLYGGPVMNAQGRLVASRPPAKLSRMVDVPLMMNLGICVRAEELLVMLDELKTQPMAPSDADGQPTTAPPNK